MEDEEESSGYMNSENEVTRKKICLNNNVGNLSNNDIN